MDRAESRDPTSPGGEGQQSPPPAGIGAIALAALGAALLGAVLALGVLAWLNDGELEFVPAVATAEAGAVPPTGGATASRPRATPRPVPAPPGSPKATATLRILP